MFVIFFCFEFKKFLDGNLYASCNYSSFKKARLVQLFPELHSNSCDY